MSEKKYDVEKMKKELLEINPTLYCSARAHLRGKLHMSKLNGGTLEQIGKYCWRYEVVDERRHMFRWTMKDQAAYVADVLKDYDLDRVEEEPQVAVETPKPSLFTRVVNMIIK